MAQSPRGGLYGPPSKRHVGVCAIYSETTVLSSGQVAMNHDSLFVSGGSFGVASSLAELMKKDSRFPTRLCPAGARKYNGLQMVLQSLVLLASTLVAMASSSHEKLNTDNLYTSNRNKTP